MKCRNRWLQLYYTLLLNTFCTAAFIFCLPHESGRCVSIMNSRVVVYQVLISSLPHPHLKPIAVLPRLHILIYHLQHISSVLWWKWDKNDAILRKMVNIFAKKRILYPIDSAISNALSIWTTFSNFDDRSTSRVKWWQSETLRAICN